MAEHEMELGNMIFGHSRGEWPIPRTDAYSGPLFVALEALGLDGYGAPKRRPTDGNWAYKSDTVEIHPYCWCDGESCPQCGTGEQPNFKHFPSGLEVRWYKYPLRDAYANRKVSTREWFDIMASVIASAPENANG